MAYTVGSAKINIHPDLKGFREKLQDQWDREVKKFNEENKDNGPEVTPQLNKEGLKKSIAEANKAIRDDASISDIDVKGRVNIDTSEIDKANARLAKAFKSVKQNAPEIQYTGNTDVQVDQIEKLNKGFKENIALLQSRPGVPLYEYGEEEQRQLMAEQAEKLTAPLAVTYCNRCTAGLLLGGAKAVHLMELCMGTWQG